MRYFFIFIILISYTLPLIPKTPTRRLVTIMLDPYGDAGNTGRLIGDTFERGLTLSFAQDLKKILEREHAHTRIILTRFPGETIEPLQNALFANTLGVDFYISLLFFWQKEGLSPVFLYHLIYHPTTDFWHTINNELKFYPYNKAYLFNLQTSYNFGQAIFQDLKKLSTIYHYEMKAFLGIPFLPLSGIIAPSIALEIGLKDTTEWEKFIEPVALALHPIIKSLKSEFT